MELVHKFEVPLDVESAWRFANDPASAVPCMPGATFEGSDSDGKLRGRVKVKLGAMVSNFAIEARYVDVDPVQHTLKVVSEGSEVRGGGRSSAEIFMKIDPKDDKSSWVNVTIQLRITGKIAQFGKGVLQDVSEALLVQFLKNVKAKAGTISSATSDVVGSAVKTGSANASFSQDPTSVVKGSLSQEITATPDEAVDLMQIGRSAIGKRIVPYAVGIAIALVIGCLWGWIGWLPLR